ncbi:T9SS type A sorting domain-containing protein [bacterium]|nr:T9SS type A sorting domain-containing protein [bacterium]
MTHCKFFIACILCLVLVSTTILMAVERPEKATQVTREILKPTYESTRTLGQPDRDDWPDDFWGLRYKYSSDGGANWSEMLNAGDAGMWEIDPAGETVPTFGSVSLDLGTVIDADNNLHVMAVLNEFSEVEDLNPLDRVNGLYHILLNTEGDATYTVIVEEGEGSFFYTDAGIDGEGNLYVIWCNTVTGEEGPEAWEIWASKSADNGENWIDPVLIAGELELGYNFAKMTYDVGDYFYVIYQIPGEVGQAHNIAKVPAGLDGMIATTETGLESSHPYYSYKFGACNPIAQDLAAGFIYFVVSDEDRTGIHIGTSEDGDSWESIAYTYADEILGPATARYPSLWMKADEEIPYVFANYSGTIQADGDYNHNCYTYDELYYNGGSWIEPPFFADSVLYESGVEEIIYLHQGLWTPAGSWVRGTSVWGIPPIYASMVTYWDEDAGDWAERQRIVNIFADPPLDAASIADPTYLAGTEDHVWAVYTGMYGETDMIPPACQTISVSSVMLGEDKVVEVTMTDDSGIGDPMFNWIKDAEGYGWEMPEEPDSMNVDPFGSGTYWYHLPDEVEDAEGNMQPLEAGDNVFFYADAYDNNSNYGSEELCLWIVNESWTGVEENVVVPFSLELGNNYPNPFNNSTVIPFTINRATDVKISVYDVNGRLVSTLFDGKAATGRHEVAWDGEGVTSGVYIYTLETTDVRYVGKMTLIR